MMRIHVVFGIVLFALAQIATPVFSAAREDPDKYIKTKLDSQYAFFADDGVLLIEEKLDKAVFYPLPAKTIKEECKEFLHTTLGRRGYVLLRKSDKGAFFCFLTEDGWTVFEAEKTIHKIFEKGENSIYAIERNDDAKTANRWELVFSKSKLEWKFIREDKLSFKDGTKHQPEFGVSNDLGEDAPANLDAGGLQIRFETHQWKTTNPLISGDVKFYLQVAADSLVGDKLKYRIINSKKEEALSEFEFDNFPAGKPKFPSGVRLVSVDDSNVFALLGWVVKVEDGKETSVLRVSKDSGKNWKDVFVKEWNDRRIRFFHYPWS